MTIDENPGGTRPYDAVVFDLLTALIDSWTLWNDVAGSDDGGLRWRAAYLKLTYGAGAYRDYETIVREAAVAAGIGPECALALVARWHELRAWPEVPGVLAGLSRRVKLAVVTNCSVILGNAAADAVFPGFDIVVTAEEAGFYKPRREPYARALERLGAAPQRTLFVAGSASDVPGALALGMTAYWHNRIGLTAQSPVAPAYQERSLDRLLELV